MASRSCQFYKRLNSTFHHHASRIVFQFSRSNILGYARAWKEIVPEFLFHPRSAPMSLLVANKAVSNFKTRAQSIPVDHVDSDFASKLKLHFENILKTKWACDTPGHSMCVLTEEGGHHQISEDGLAVWVDALCRGGSTTAQPPNGVLPRTSDRFHGDSASPQVLLHSLSHHRSARSPISLRTESFQSTLVSSTTGALGPGYRGGQFLEWLGEKVLLSVERLFFAQRLFHYRYQLHRWSKTKKSVIRAGIERRLISMLGDTFEMARPYYSRHTNDHAFQIFMAMTKNFCAVVLGAGGGIRIMPSCISRLTLSLFCQGQQQHKRALAWELYHVVISKYPELLPRELALSDFTCATPGECSHADVGSICELANTAMTRPLTPKELAAINELVECRQRKRGKSLADCKPWDVVAIAFISEQWHHDFKKFILGPFGFQGFTTALMELEMADVVTPRDWFTINDIIIVFNALLQIDWVVDAAEPGLLSVLLDVLRRDAPEQHKVCIMQNGLLSIRRIVTKKADMVAVLIEKNGKSLFGEIIDNFAGQDLVSDAKFLTSEMDRLHKSILSSHLTWKE